MNQQRLDGMDPHSIEQDPGAQLFPHALAYAE
jgi:hypothetical protein